MNICGYLERSWTPQQLVAIDQIFFSSSATQTFANAAERAAFRERWLGRYLQFDAAHAFVAIDAAGSIVGYLVGAIEDLARNPRFADLSTVQAFAAVSARYPAHLHINVAAPMRGHGVGAELIGAFAAHAVDHGAPGMHVVTNAASRNVHFYHRCGFVEVDRVTVGTNEALFLGRRLLSAQITSSAAD